MKKPQTTEYDAYYEKYVSLIGESELMTALEGQPSELSGLTAALPEEKGSYAYADGKWTIKEMLSHLIDGERIFGYRMLRISRGDVTPIEGFEQDGYIENSHANERPFADLIEEFGLTRKANLMMMRNLRAEDWARSGTANDVSVTVRALAYIMAGHFRHHANILRERYLD
jgi:hypothetical protein